MAEYICKEDFIKILKEKSPIPFVETNVLIGAVSVFPAADVQPVKWIPFEIRDLDEEEKEEHPEWDCILDGELPEDGQRILVNVKFKGHESVQMDEFYSDCDGSYLDSGYDIGTEVTHWMPLPEPLKDGET